MCFYGNLYPQLTVHYCTYSSGYLFLSLNYKEKSPELVAIDLRFELLLFRNFILNLGKCSWQVVSLST